MGTRPSTDLLTFLHRNPRASAFASGSLGLTLWAACGEAPPRNPPHQSAPSRQISTLAGIGYGTGSVSLVKGTDLVRVRGSITPGKGICVTYAVWSPETESYRKQLVPIATDYAPHHLCALDPHNFFVAGHHPNRGLILERIHIEHRFGSPVRPGQESDPGSNRVPLVTPPEPPLIHPAVCRHVMREEPTSGPTHALCVDPEGRFLIYACSSGSGLRQLFLDRPRAEGSEWFPARTLLKQTQEPCVAHIHRLALGENSNGGRILTAFTHLSYGSRHSTALYLYDTDNNGRFESHQTHSTRELLGARRKHPQTYRSL